MATLEATGKLAGPKLRLWYCIKNSEWLMDETVGSFLGRENSKARRNLLRRASKHEDGTYAISEDDAELLADALFALLSPGALARGRGALGRAQ